MSNLIPAPPTGSAASMCDSRGRPASSPATRRPRTAPPLVIARLSPPFTAAGASTPPRSGTPGSPARSAAANLHTGAVLGVAVQCSSPTYVHRLNDPRRTKLAGLAPSPQLTLLDGRDSIHFRRDAPCVLRQELTPLRSHAGGPPTRRAPKWNAAHPAQSGSCPATPTPDPRTDPAHFPCTRLPDRRPAREHPRRADPVPPSCHTSPCPRTSPATPIRNGPPRLGACAPAARWPDMPEVGARQPGAGPNRDFWAGPPHSSAASCGPSSPTGSAPTGCRPSPPGSGPVRSTRHQPADQPAHRARGPHGPAGP